MPLAVQRRDGDPRGAARGRGAAGCSTWAAGRASWCRRCSRTRGSPRSSAWTCRCGRCTIAARRLRLDRMAERQAARVKLLQGSLAYTDKRLKGYDAAVLSEVIEHLDLPRLPALEYAVFGAARPPTVVVTTPNVEYNVRWETLPAGHVRHGDHRFEWTGRSSAPGRGQVAERHGYGVEFVPVGPDDPEVGPPTQMAVFTQRPTARPTTRRRRTEGTHDQHAGTDTDAERGARCPVHRPVPRRPGRRHRIGQVHLRPQALQAHRGHLLRLLPRPGRRRRERPEREPATPSTSCTTSRASGSPPAG